MFTLSNRSKTRLRGVHPDLVKVVDAAIEITPVDFVVLEGLRTEARQRELVQSGASRTMKSRHLTGHAVDLGAWVGEVRWDWPLYHQIADAMKDAAEGIAVDLEWGGDWQGGFKDGPHFQLSWKSYPA